jgi:hypothetical protein
MRSPTKDRDSVSKIAPRDPKRALVLARAIPDYWFRCQALSAAAYHWPKARDRDNILQEAIEAANLTGEPNRIVTVASWPLKVWAVKGSIDRVTHEGDRLLDLIAKEPSPVRRADALLHLFGAVVGLQHGITLRVADALTASCLEPLRSGRRNRKGDSILAQCLPAIFRIDERRASDALARLPSARAEIAREKIVAAQSTPLNRLVPWPHFAFD